MKEEWAKLDYLPADVEVSNLGKVRKDIGSGEYMLTAGSISNGVRYISAKGRSYAVHRLVADAFVPNPEGLPRVIHKDGNNLNNEATNLEWISRAENISRNLKKGATSKPAIYCEELDKMFASLRSASYVTGLQQEWISWAISEGVTICGLTFQSIEPENVNPNYELIYFSMEDVKKMITFASSLEEFMVQVNAK